MHFTLISILVFMSFEFTLGHPYSPRKTFPWERSQIFTKICIINKSEMGRPRIWKTTGAMRSDVLSKPTVYKLT